MLFVFQQVLVLATVLLLLVDGEPLVAAPTAAAPAPATFSALLTRLEHTEGEHCDTLIALPSVHLLLEHELKRSNPQLLLLAQLIAQHPHLHPLHLPANASLTLDSPLAYNLSAPLYVLQLHCDLAGDESAHRWIPVLIYPTAASESYLTVRVRPFPLNACALPHCATSKVNLSTLNILQQCTLQMFSFLHIFAPPACTLHSSALPPMRLLYSTAAMPSLICPLNAKFLLFCYRGGGVSVCRGWHSRLLTTPSGLDFKKSEFLINRNFFRAHIHHHLPSKNILSDAETKKETKTKVPSVGCHQKWDVWKNSNFRLPS